MENTKLKIFDDNILSYILSFLPIFEIKIFLEIMKIKHIYNYCILHSKQLLTIYDFFNEDGYKFVEKLCVLDLNSWNKIMENISLLYNLKSLKIVIDNFNEDITILNEIPGKLETLYINSAYFNQNFGTLTKPLKKLTLINENYNQKLFLPKSLESFMLWTGKYNQDFSTIKDNTNLRSIYLESNSFNKKIELPDTTKKVEFWFNNFSKNFIIPKKAETFILNTVSGLYDYNPPKIPSSIKVLLIKARNIEISINNNNITHPRQRTTEIYGQYSLYNEPVDEYDFEYTRMLNNRLIDDYNQIMDTEIEDE